MLFGIGCARTLPALELILALAGSRPLLRHVEGCAETVPSALIARSIGPALELPLSCASRLRLPVNHSPNYRRRWIRRRRSALLAQQNCCNEVDYLAHCLQVR